MRLGDPHRVGGNVRVIFRGDGPARFRLQHAGDLGGEPDELTWCDVSNAGPADELKNGEIRSVLVGRIEGDTEVIYRRHTAEWLRVVPEEDSEAEACRRYNLEVVPLTR